MATQVREETKSVFSIGACTGAYSIPRRGENGLVIQQQKRPRKFPGLVDILRGYQPSCPTIPGAFAPCRAWYSAIRRFRYSSHTVINLLFCSLASAINATVWSPVSYSASARQ